MKNTPIVSEEDGFKQLYETLMEVDKTGALKEGSNQIRVVQNGYKLEIRCFIKNGDVFSLDAFVQIEPNPRDIHNVINIDW